jgi:hypothetical protein
MQNPSKKHIFVSNSVDRCVMCRSGSRGSSCACVRDKRREKIAVWQHPQYEERPFVGSASNSRKSAGAGDWVNQWNSIRRVTDRWVLERGSQLWWTIEWTSSSRGASLGGTTGAGLLGNKAVWLLWNPMISDKDFYFVSHSFYIKKAGLESLFPRVHSVRNCGNTLLNSPYRLDELYWIYDDVIRLHAVTRHIVSLVVSYIDVIDSCVLVIRRA